MKGWAARVLLRLLPAAYRTRFGDDMRRDWEELRRAIRREQGRAAEWRYVARELGAFLRLVRETRVAAIRGSHSGSGWRVDVRAALRRVRQKPIQVSATCLMLSAAFTVTLVAFGITNAVLWRDLPFADPDRLVAVWERSGPVGSLDAARVTGSRFLDWASRATAFDGLAAFGAAGYQVDRGDGVTTVRGVRAAGNFFELLGVAPVAGRLFQRSDQAPGADRVVVLSHAYWRAHYGARESVVGQTLRLSGQPHTIIGVLPDVWLPSWPVNPSTIQLQPEHRHLWVPLPAESVLAQNQGSHVLGVIGRLASGHSPESARQQLESLVSADQPHQHGGIVRPLRAQMVQQTSGPLWMLLAGACCVLIVAALNLAAIDLAAFEARLNEFRVRAALGASASALTRQLFFESAPVVGLAAGISLGATHAVLAALPARFSTRIPLVTPPALDAPAVALLATLSLLVIVLMTTWPVLRVRRLSRLRDQHSTRVTAGNPVVFRGLLVGQLTGAVALVLTSTALVQAFIGIGARDPGFDPANVHIVELSLPRDRYSAPEPIVAFERHLQERATVMPGVRAAAVSHDHPFEANWSTVVRVIGDAGAGDDDAQSQVQLRIVGPDYVPTMGARVVAGRSFRPLIDAKDAGEVLVNEAFVQRHAVALGRALAVSGPAFTWGDAVPQTFTVVGILQDERFRGLEEDVEPAVYVSTRQFPQTDLTLLLRMTPGQRPSAGDIRALLRDIDAGVSAGVPLSLEGIDAEQRLTRTLTTMVITGFASGALVLAAIGLYGMLSLRVGSRQRDIGIRLALGASPQQIRQGVFRDGLIPVAAGLTLGVGLAALASAGLSALLTGVTVWTPTSVVLVVAVIAVVAVLAAAGPARRAARTDPTAMLR